MGCLSSSSPGPLGLTHVAGGRLAGPESPRWLLWPVWPSVLAVGWGVSDLIYMTLHPPVGEIIFLACRSKGSALRERSQKWQAVLRPSLQNVPITCTSFCWPEQFTRPAQIQGGRDIDSSSGLKMLQKHISKVSAYWDGKRLWPLNNVSQGAMCLLLLCGAPSRAPGM